MFLVLSVVFDRTFEDFLHFEGVEFLLNILTLDISIFFDLKSFTYLLDKFVLYIKQIKRNGDSEIGWYRQ